jgi:GGDEF domain-containing protein
VGAVTCSIGLALYEPAHPLTSAELLDLADRRLYLAKQTGRDRVVDW